MMEGKEQFAEYGGEKSLQEILEELSLYCSINFADVHENNIKLILPDKILKQYTKTMFAKERIVIKGNIVQEPVVLEHPVLWIAGGTVALFSLDEHTVTKKRKKK